MGVLAPYVLAFRHVDPVMNDGRYGASGVSEVERIDLLVERAEGCWW